MNPILKLVADNPALHDALLKHITEEFSTLLVGIDTNKTNEELGEVVRARLQGIEKVRDAFKKISQLKTTPDSSEKRNPAR